MLKLKLDRTHGHKFFLVSLVVLASACGSADPITVGNNGGGPGPGPTPDPNFSTYCTNSGGRLLSQNNETICEWNRNLYSFNKFAPNFIYSYYNWNFDILPRLTPTNSFYAENVQEGLNSPDYVVQPGDRIAWSASNSSYWGESNVTLGCDNKIRLNGEDENQVIQTNGMLPDNTPAPQGLLARAGDEVFVLGTQANFQINGSGGELLIGFNAPTSSFDRCWSIQNWNLRVQHCENINRETISCPM